MCIVILYRSLMLIYKNKYFSPMFNSNDHIKAIMLVGNIYCGRSYFTV